MENNSQQPAPAVPAAKVTPMAAVIRTAETAGSAAQPQRGTGTGSMHQVHAVAGTGTGSMFGPTAQCGASATMQPNPVVFGKGSSSSNQAMQGSSSIQPVAAPPLAAARHGPTAQHGAAMPWWLPPAALRPSYRVARPTKLKTKRAPSPPPPKLPVYRPPPPPMPELLGSNSAAGNAMLQPSTDTSFCVSNMQADPPSPGQVTMAEEGSGSEGGGSSGDDVKTLDLNFPPVSDDEN